MVMGGRGVRFAPSPTGVFHVGNLRTAWVAFQLARAFNEDLVVRVEDIDTARVLPEAREKQRRDLEALEIWADQTVIQSSRHDRHLELFKKARTAGLIYPCDCSRREVLESLTQMQRAPHAPLDDAGGAIEYTGRCRHRTSGYVPAETLAWRWKSADESGQHDVIIARTDATGEKFVPGYNWACAIDDADGGYHLLVRAWDLASVDRVQSEIRRWALSSDASSTDHGTSREPLVFHTTLVTRDDGGRLEKRTQGVTLDELLSRGYDVDQILGSFSTSFDFSAALATLRSPPPAPETWAKTAFGEFRKTISLSELGLQT